MITTENTPETISGERTDLLAELASARFFLRKNTRDLTDEQARQRTTVSELCLGGLIKHVAATEESWGNFILEGPLALGWGQGLDRVGRGRLGEARGGVPAASRGDPDRRPRRLRAGRATHRRTSAHPA